MEQRQPEVMNYSAHHPDIVQTDLVSLNMTERENKTSLTLFDYTEGKIALALNNYYLLCLCPIALVLNSAAVLTISKLKPFTTSSLYVILLAIFDSLALIVKLAFLQLTLNDVELRNAGCAILSFMGSFFDQFSVWLLVLLTIERFVAVWLPLKVSGWFTMSRARIAVIATALCLLAINSNILFVICQEERETKGGTRRDCGFCPQFVYYGHRVWYWIESCLTAIIPCIALIMLNCLIVYRMRASMEKQKQMLGGVECPNKTKQAHKTHLTAMLVTVSVSFVFMVLPLSIFNIFRGTWQKAAQSNPHEIAKYYMTGELTHLLADCNHGLNFLFYFLSSRRFRRMCSWILRCNNPYELYRGGTRGGPSTNTYYLHTSVRTNGGI